MASEGQKSESCGAPQIAVLFTYFREQNLTWAIGVSYPGPHSDPIVLALGFSILILQDILLF